MTGGGQADYYAVLGVPRTASAPDIRRAYRRVARRHHPDVNRDPLGPQQFAAAARAYAVLSDPAARASYDERSRPRPASVPRRPAPAPAPWRGVLELTGSEAAWVARVPLVLTSASTGPIVVPAGTGDGDELVLSQSDRMIVLRVRCGKRT